MKETISGKNDVWGCNVCMKDNKSGCYQKNAIANYHQYVIAKEKADLCVTRSKTNPTLKKPVVLTRKEKDSRGGNDEEETNDDEEEEVAVADGVGKQTKSTRSTTRYCR